MNNSSTEKNTRVVVALSGGVDSSVAAALLKDRGYDVIGVSLKLWDYDEAERKVTGKTCCSLDDIADARDVCRTLGIPFYAFNHKPQFQKKVIETFVNEYHSGRTPNPCILCNQHIKFDLLLKEAQKLGASYLATGHYARITRDAEEICHLSKGRDPEKDQSYVLFHLTQEELRQILFPVGDYTKDEIRKLAKQYGLVTSSKRESMDICFIPDNDHAAFIAKNYPRKKSGSGNFVDCDGNVLGRHEGIEAYTIGQRKGLGIGFGRRLYVSEIRPGANEVMLAPEEEVYFKGLKVTSCHFIQQPADKVYGAKIRYQKDEIPARLLQYDRSSNSAIVEFQGLARAVTPGQALVLYDEDEVIGGGWIHSAIRNHQGESRAVAFS